MGSKKNEVAKSFAQWTSKPHYNVTFNAGDHGVISGSNIVDRYEGQMIANADVPVVKPNDHYILKGWTPEFTEHAVTQNETYTAIYEYIAATVHFNTGENGESVPDREIDRGSSIENLPNPRHKSGIFVGWYSDNGLQNAVDLSTWKMPSPAVETTFYAKWDLNAVKRVVSYVVSGGTASFASVVKVLLDSEGWASTSGRYTLVEADIPTVTADATHEGNPTWVPKNPLGSVLNVNATFTATFAEKRVRVQVVGNEHVDITNGDQTVVIGSAITPIVVKPKSGWGYGYSETNLTSLSKNGLTAVYSGYDNSITISGSLSVDTTLTAPICSSSGDFRFIFCDNTSCAEISGMVYNLSEDNKTTWLTVNGTTDVNSSTKIYGLTVGSNITLSVKEVPAGFNMPGSDTSYGVKGRTDEVYVLYGSVGSVLPGTDPAIVEIHQNVVGSESNKLDIFKYDVNINNNTTRLYIQGTKDAKLTGTMGTHTYSIVQLDENKYGYITSIISGSLSGSINTNSETPAILTTKYLKGEEGQGQLVIRCYLDGAYIPGHIKDESTFTPEDIKVKTGITLFGENVNVVGEHGNFNFENNFAQTIISVPGYNTGLQVKAAGANKLPSCGYGVSTEIVYPSYWPEWAKDHVRIENSRMSGQIMNTTLTDAELRMIYKTSGTWEISVEGDVVSSPSSIPSLIISLLNNDDSLWLIDAQFGDVNFMGGRVNINGRKLETTQMMRLPAVSKRIKFSASKDSKYDYVPEFIWFESSNSGAPFPGDINDLPIVIKENSNERILIRWVKNVLPGTVAPDPNCNIADVQVNGVSIESGVTTFNWNQTLKIVYKNQLQTGGLNALWAAFGETEYTSLVTNLDASVNINTSVVEASWQGLPQDQYDLVNSLKDTAPFIQIYDENGLPSKFAIVNVGCNKLNTPGGADHSGSTSGGKSLKSGISVRNIDHISSNIATLNESDSDDTE